MGARSKGSDEQKGDETPVANPFLPAKLSFGIEKEGLRS